MQIGFNTNAPRHPFQVTVASHACRDVFSSSKNLSQKEGIFPSYKILSHPNTLCVTPLSIPEPKPEFTTATETLNLALRSRSDTSSPTIRSKSAMASTYLCRVCGLESRI